PQDEPATKRVQALAQKEKAWCFSGDFHGYERSTHGDVVQVVSGGAGGKAEDQGPHHFVVVTVDEKGVLRDERRDVAEVSAESPTLDRLRTVRDESAWTSHAMPLPFALAWVLATTSLGGLVGAVWRRRQRGRADEGTSA